MALVTFLNKTFHLKGDITAETPKAVTLAGKHGPIIIPMRFISHITVTEKADTP